ncbi:diphthine--ammonia ligase [Candidatus Pacearchaeota archaeon]|nr:diphthine--ammonia ligase [Candidatus Pacearchaeota archaeon]
MKLGILFSGGKDSTYAAFLAKKYGHELTCLISLFSSNKDSYMFHTPLIELTKKQAEFMRIPQIIFKTAGKKEEEVKDLEKAIKLAIKNHNIRGVVTGAVESVYQASRIQNICNRLKIECFNPLWQKNPQDYWKEMLALDFKIIIVRVAADGLDEKWLGKEITKDNFVELEKLSRKHLFHLGFEGGEAETFVLGCPLFEKSLQINEVLALGEGKAWKGGAA